MYRLLKSQEKVAEGIVCDILRGVLGSVKRRAEASRVEQAPALSMSSMHDTKIRARSPDE